MSRRNGRVKRTRLRGTIRRLCRFCERLISKGDFVRTFTIHGKTVYECAEHPFPRESVIRSTKGLKR